LRPCLVSYANQKQRHLFWYKSLLLKPQLLFV
jgi:hypothetical protein